jgi:hypothetical protein
MTRSNRCAARSGVSLPPDKILLYLDNSTDRARHMQLMQEAFILASLRGFATDAGTNVQKT